MGALLSCTSPTAPSDDERLVDVLPQPDQVAQQPRTVEPAPAPPAREVSASAAALAKRLSKLNSRSAIEREIKRGGDVMCVAWSPNGERLAAKSDGKVAIYDVASGSIARELKRGGGVSSTRSVLSRLSA